MQVLEYNASCPETSFLALAERPKPQLNNSNAIIQVAGVGVCGSDLLKLNHGLVKEGEVLGHEMVGIIDEISPSLAKQYSLAIGDRIVSSHHSPCLKCKFCLNEQESLCTEFKRSNFYPGAFAEYLELSEEHLRNTVLKIPEHLENSIASFTEPLACCLKACKRSQILSYQGKAKVLVLGLGSIGLLLGQSIKYYKPDIELHGVDLIPSRLNLASELGFDFQSQEANGKYDFIFLASGASATVETAIKHSELGARILTFSSAHAAAFSNDDIYYKELSVIGSYSPNLSDLKTSLDLLSQKIIHVQSFITHRSNLANLGATIVRSRQEQGIKVYCDLLSLI